MKNNPPDIRNDISEESVPQPAISRRNTPSLIVFGEVYIKIE
jgi:hypothetical protein